jgi:hypothetical protein
MPTEIMNLAGIPARLMESGFHPAHADIAASLRDILREQNR